VITKHQKEVKMPKAKWKHLLSYWFDNQLAKGPLVLISWLGITTFLLVLLATLVALFFNIQPTDTGFKEVFWDFLFQALTPNPFDVTAPGLFLIMMLFITLLSLLMVSILIGILTTSIENRINDLRRGRSLVIENEHTVILGWSNQIFTIISELIVANENRKDGAVIVIMANQDKVGMDESTIPKIRASFVVQGRQWIWMISKLSVLTQREPSLFCLPRETTPILT
jgi:hypothetical protein